MRHYIQMVQARSPLRIDFVGMTDYVPACERFGGSIVNATINKYIYATAIRRTDRRVILYAPDQDELRVELTSVDELDAQGPLGLAQEIVRRFDLNGGGVELTTYSEMPAGAGLGSSSTIATSIIAVMDAMTGRKLANYEMAEMARECESVALNTTYGWQDQYSPVTGGGMKYMRYWPSCGPDGGGPICRGIEVDSIRMSPADVAEIEKSLVVCFSGISRPAKSILDAVASGVRDDREDVVGALKGMNALAEEFRHALLEKRLTDIGPLIDEVWALHKRLHPDVTNDRVEELCEIARRAGATGGRVCGAGGGGTMMFWCAPNLEHAVRRALRDADARIFDFSIDMNGLILW
jgi:D-glycero-alpha-D-manno-heptose-7-phosphate kinase